LGALSEDSIRHFSHENPLSADGSVELLERLDGSHLIITGASGFVGTALLQELQQRLPKNHLKKLTCVSRSLPRNTEGSPLAGLNVEWVNLDVETQLVKLPPADYLIHAATPSNAQVQAADPLALMQGIIRGVMSVIEWAKTNPVPPRVLFTSSGAVYGRLNMFSGPFSEHDPGLLESFSIDNAYAEGKRVGETFLALAGNAGLLSPVCARLFSFIGPHLPQNGHFAIGNFIGSASKGEPVVIQGTGTLRRSYMYETDMAAWILRGLSKPEAPLGPINIGSPIGMSLAEVGAAVAKLADVDLVIQGNVECDGKRLDYVPQTANTESELAVKQTVSLTESIVKTLNSCATSDKHVTH
jgi:dTDP-glucose 4,6-dehydratase